MNDRIAAIDPAAALERIQGVVKRTPLVPFDAGQPAVELRLKLENFQETGAFKARGAWNNVSRLTPEERAAGLVATSSGNHGRALAWAARRAEVAVTLYMPADSYPNKIEACRELGAEVVLCETRRDAEEQCARHVAAGGVLIHPYDRDATIEGAGTTGVEVARDWPEIEVLVVPVGGGGLVAGCALAVRRELGDRVVLIGAEPEGAPSMTRGLREGRQVELEEITTSVQGLCPISSGELNIAIARKTFVRMQTLPDEAIYAAQDHLVRAGYTVEPAGAAAYAVVHSERLPAELLAGRSESDPLRVGVIVSGGNPDPAQLEALRKKS